MSQHDEAHLAEAIRNTSLGTTEIMDAIKSAGWVKPTVLTTAEQLDSLPAGSVILSNGGEDSAQKDDDGYWYLWGGDIGLESSEINLPADLLHEGQA